MSHIYWDYSLMILLLLLLLQFQLQPWIAEARCNNDEELANGVIQQRRNYLRFRCSKNYVLLGRPMYACGRDGRISGMRPFCARPGCTRPPDPDNGEIAMERDLTAVIYCKENFVVAGNHLAYCNGYSWDRQLGECRPANHSQSHACDFETEDRCGWTTQLSLMQPWRRVSTVAHFHSYRTGPRHDHTVQNAYGGHYMLMESNIMAYGEHHLLSPIYDRELSLKTACCFRFHYFMYGANVGTLAVSVKPSQLRLDLMWAKQALYLKFNITGNQGNQWLEHTISIDEMSDDFQVVFTASGANSHFGDIAIDDVRLITGKECGGNGITTTTEEPVRETAEPVVWDEMSCKYRCNKTAPPDDIFMLEHLIKSCGCDELCVDLENCCSDYFSICFERDEDTLPDSKPTTTPAPTKATTMITTPTPTTKATTKRATPTPSATTTRRANTTTASTTRKTTTTKATTTTKTPAISTSTRRSTTSTRRYPISTTTLKTTPKRTTPKATTPKTTTPKATTPRITTTTAKATTTTTSSTALPHDIAASTTPLHRKHISWPVNPDDIEGKSAKQNSSNPARFMWIFMLTIMLIIIVASVLYRWKRPQGSTIETTVSFQKTLAKLKTVTIPRGNRIRRCEANTPLCENTSDNENDEIDGVQIEEMGVDIRNVTEL